MVELLKRKYNIKRQVGHGGMAEIFLANDKETGKEVAIKILEPSSRNDRIKQKRFMHEIRLLKKVDSPHVVKLFDAEMSDANCYIVMEYVDGDILKDYIKNRSRLTVDEAVEFAIQLAEGFDEIHRNGIIHRDIKSQNIMVAEGGMIKIIDFGIAIDADSEELTRTDMLIGSPQYVSPELIRQEVPTIQSDIYALGIIMYEMIAGDVPFSGSSALDTLTQHRDKPMPKICQRFPNIPQSVENIILKATAKDQTKRFKDMYEMRAALKKALKPEHMNELPIHLEGKPRKKLVERMTSKAAMIGLFSVLLVAVVTLLIVILVKGF